MLTKESKIRVLENFHALDYILFGRSVKEMNTCCPLVKEEYLSIKGALMSVYIEMLKITNHTPSVVKESVDSKMLKKNARMAAKIARENSQKIVSSGKARENIKSMLKEELQKNPKVNVSSLVEKSIRNKAFGLAIDNLLIARSVNECKSFDKLNEWEGQIIEDSYKVLRDSLVEAAYMMLYNEQEDKKDESLTEAPIQYSASKIISMAKAHGTTVENQAKAGCEKWSIKAPFKSTEYKKKMLACKAAAAIKGLQASAVYAKNLVPHCKGDCRKQIADFLRDISDEIKENQEYVKMKV